MVKQRLEIQDSETTYDTVLDAKITAADVSIDEELREFTSVPLSTVPQVIKEISADWATGLFTQDRFPADAKGDLLIKRAKEALDRYIAKNYKPKKESFVVTAQPEGLQ